MFRAHKTEVFIPGGLTSVLQPLDVCLNKPFKDRVRKMWSEWGIYRQVMGTWQKDTVPLRFK